MQHGAGSDLHCLENELLVDFVATEPNVTLPNVTTFTAAPGRAPANVAVTVRRLGRTCDLVVLSVKVGDDVFGIKLRGDCPND
jgi:sugar/nucleoside kinase (ribokinase family)